MKKLKIERLNFNKLSKDEMKVVSGGRAGTITGCRWTENQCFIDVIWHDTGEVECELERSM
ncbi:MAG: hypothetical protein LBG19_05910 [Prevotellaceae bacterium]|jgi:natural product precursor|nr:hypothetical protein [Prevotellaceae bacterium]